MLQHVCLLYTSFDATPTTISWNTGRFGPGRVDAWFRSSTMRAGPRGTLSLEADDTRGYEDNGRTNVQWLEDVYKRQILFS